MHSNFSCVRCSHHHVKEPQLFATPVAQERFLKKALSRVGGERISVPSAAFRVTVTWSEALSGTKHHHIQLTMSSNFQVVGMIEWNERWRMIIYVPSGMNDVGKEDKETREPISLHPICFPANSSTVGQSLAQHSLQVNTIEIVRRELVGQKHLKAVVWSQRGMQGQNMSSEDWLED